MKKRLFIALGASEIARPAAIFIKKLKINLNEKEVAAQFVPPENWHVTLMFLGETSAEKLPGIESRILQVCSLFDSFKLKIAQFGAFPEPHQARVIWLGVQRSQKILDLQFEMEKALEDLGFRSEGQEYWPHLTVARLRNQKNVVDALSPVVRKEIGVLRVSEVRLYESTLSTPYPRYTILKTFPLKEISA